MTNVTTTTSSYNSYTPSHSRSPQPLTSNTYPEMHRPSQQERASKRPRITSPPVTSTRSTQSDPNGLNPLLIRSLSEVQSEQLPLPLPSETGTHYQAAQNGNAGSIGTSRTNMSLWERDAFMAQCLRHVHAGIGTYHGNVPTETENADVNQVEANPTRTIDIIIDIPTIGAINIDFQRSATGLSTTPNPGGTPRITTHVHMMQATAPGMSDIPVPMGHGSALGNAQAEETLSAEHENVPQLVNFAATEETNVEYVLSGARAGDREELNQLFNIVGGMVDWSVVARFMNASSGQYVRRLYYDFVHVFKSF